MLYLCGAWRFANAYLFFKVGGEKIRKVDDKPMVIHTKEKAKIHAHEPKGAKIKGSNIYTVERGPKTAGASTNVACW